MVLNFLCVKLRYYINIIFSSISVRETLENILRDGLSLSSLSSVQKFSIKDSSDQKGQCYLGITLPMKIYNLFPSCSVTSRRLSYTNKNTLFEEMEENDPKQEEGTSGKKKKFKHNIKQCFKCGNVLRKLPLSSIKGKIYKFMVPYLLYYAFY